MSSKQKSWLSLARSIALIVVGILLLVYESLIADSPNHFVVGVGLILLGSPPLPGAIQRLRNGGE